MRLHFVIAAAALLSVSLAAHANTITESFSASGTAALAPGGLFDGFFGVSTSALADFSPSTGTLNSITITFSGSAISQSDVDGLYYVNDGAGQNLFPASSTVGVRAGDPFTFSANNTVTDGADLASFEGTGDQTLALLFYGQTSNVSVTDGTLTYNYTPAAVAATPEPSSFMLLGTGLLCLAGVFRKRLA